MPINVDHGGSPTLVAAAGAAGAIRGQRRAGQVAAQHADRQLDREFQAEQRGYDRLLRYVQSQQQRADRYNLAGLASQERAASRQHDAGKTRLLAAQRTREAAKDRAFRRKYQAAAGRQQVGLEKMRQAHQVGLEQMRQDAVDQRLATEYGHDVDAGIGERLRSGESTLSPWAETKLRAHKDELTKTLVEGQLDAAGMDEAIRKYKELERMLRRAGEQPAETPRPPVLWTDEKTGRTFQKVGDEWKQLQEPKESKDPKEPSSGFNKKVEQLFQENLLEGAGGGATVEEWSAAYDKAKQEVEAQEAQQRWLQDQQHRDQLLQERRQREIDAGRAAGDVPGLRGQVSDKDRWIAALGDMQRETQAAQAAGTFAKAIENAADEETKLEAAQLQTAFDATSDIEVRQALQAVAEEYAKGVPQADPQSTLRIETALRTLREKGVDWRKIGPKPTPRASPATSPWSFTPR